jgi:hypothetical protein
MDLIQESFQRLFPEKEFEYETGLQYNRRLGNFNSNISLHKNKLSINMNLQWKDIDKEIKIGLIQTLLLKVFKNKLSTQNTLLYNNFIKNIPILTPKTKSEPTLDLSFYRVNENLFQNEIEKPNLTWGTASKRKLACYNFHDDTITVSTIFKEAPPEVLDYLMYHELLHKYHQFNHKNGRSYFHTPKFKADENLYPNKKQIEQQINKIIKFSKKPKKPKTSRLFNFFKPL